MKKIILLSVLGFFINAHADVFVHDYYRHNGTYVKPHYRSDPNGNFNDNWSTKGNQNSYTGEFGTKTRKEYPNSFASLG